MVQKASEHANALSGCQIYWLENHLGREITLGSVTVVASRL